MYLLIYAIVLLIFWVLALRINPERHPQVDPDVLMAFRWRLLKSYQRYAGFFILTFLLSTGNGMLASYYEKHPEHLYKVLFYGLTVFIFALNVAFLIYILRKAIQHHQERRLLGL